MSKFHFITRFRFSPRQFIFLVLPLLFFGNLYVLSLSYFYKANNFLLLAMLALLYFIITKSNRIEYKFTYYDLAWWVFIALMFISSTFATNPYYCILYGSGWLLFYLFQVMTRSVNLTPAKNEIVLNILAVFFCIFLIDAAIIMMKGISYPKSHFTFHRNVIAFHLIGLYPFLLMTKMALLKNKWIKTLISLLLFMVLVYANCRGAILAYIMVILAYTYFKFSNLKQLLNWKTALLGLTALIAASAIAINIDDKILYEFFEANELDRLYMMRNSFWLLGENPILGVGAGNWKTEIFKYGIEDFSYFSNHSRYRIQSSHNIFTTILAESGIVGFAAFLYIFFYPIFRFYKKREYTPFQLACVLAVVAFLTLGLIFGMIIFFKIWLSPIMIITIFCLGQLNELDQTPLVNQKFVKPLLIVLSIMACSFYVYQTTATYTAYNAHKKLKSPKKSYTYLKQFYHPYLFLDYLGWNYLPEYMAAQSLKHGDSTLTQGYYEDGIKYNPHDAELLLKYAQYLYDDLGDYDRASELASKAIGYHPKYFDALKFLIRINLESNRLDNVEQYFEMLIPIKERASEYVALIDKSPKKAKLKKTPKNVRILNEIEELEAQYAQMINPD